MKRPAPILVADDDPVFRQMCGAMLGFAGFDVATAADGWAALNHVEHEKPRVVILDLNMPRVTGWDVLAELVMHESTRKIPVIVVTGEDPRGVDPSVTVVRKPATYERLLPLVSELLTA